MWLNRRPERQKVEDLQKNVAHSSSSLYKESFQPSIKWMEMISILFAYYSANRKVNEWHENHSYVNSQIFTLFIGIQYILDKSITSFIILKCALSIQSDFMAAVAAVACFREEVMD